MHADIVTFCWVSLVVFAFVAILIVTEFKQQRTKIAALTAEVKATKDSVFDFQRWVLDLDTPKEAPVAPPEMTYNRSDDPVAGVYTYEITTSKVKPSKAKKKIAKAKNKIPKK